jgi:hypothetical protein
MAAGRAIRYKPPLYLLKVFTFKAARLAKRIICAKRGFSLLSLPQISNIC